MISTISPFLVKRLSRRTSGRAFIPEVDGLRSVAILSVVFFHANVNYIFYAGAPDVALGAAFNRLVHAGEYGVMLFFVISGFILSIPFARQHLEGASRVNLKKYLVRRITRLEPPYIFALIVLFLISAIRMRSFERFPNFLASSVYIHNILYEKTSTILFVAWSLEVEVQFYLLAPLISLVFVMKNTMIRRLVLLVSIFGLTYFFNVSKPIDGLSILSHGSYFLIGLFLADLYLADQRQLATAPEPLETRSNLYGTLADCIAVLSLSMVFVCKAYNLWPELVAPWLIMIGYAAVFRARWVRKFFRLTPIVILGGMCYTIYLWHFFFISAFRTVWFRFMPSEEGLGFQFAYIVVASSIALAGSAIFFAIIERPTMDPNWPRKLWGGLRGLLKIGSRSASSS